MKSDLPPDECIEVALWDRFKWSRVDTERLSSRDLKVLFAILEQQRVSTYLKDNFKPDWGRMQNKISEESAKHAVNNPNEG